MKLSRIMMCGITAALAGGIAQADNWDAWLTVDNQFDVYFGTPLATNFYAGGGTNWAVSYNFTATGRPPTDYLYVATASDFSVAQGFIGIFTNTTTSTSIVTGSSVWEVFPAGAYLQQIFGMSGSWPYLTMPTQTQVDAAIAYATLNNLWVAPSTAPGYDNDPPTPTTPYFYPWGSLVLPNIPSNAQWIWYDSGGSTPGPYAVPINGFNHDEFLVFRVPGIAPEPASAALLALGGLAMLRRRSRR
ncbi:MAG: PEP-CTERM sorting domain-containing protein [Planctomycetes bacterium]|nr:PEP-CTERM sorting domain-containing protein [Planctomycetota bacterium]